jgi:SAM-dependent methyltransferase
MGGSSSFLSVFPTFVLFSSWDRSKVVIPSRSPGTRASIEFSPSKARAANIEKAKFIGSLLGVSNVEFRQANLEHLQLASVGYFDAIFCCGLLYHLPEPWKLVSQLPFVAPSLFVWTVYADEDEATIEIDGLRGREYVEGGLNEPLSGLSPKSIWLTLPSLLELLKRSGYVQIEILEKAQNPNGPAVSLAASLN